MSGVSNYMTEQEARKTICEIGKRLYSKNFVAANDGNLSVKTGEDEIICTPTGVSKGVMTEDMLVKIRMNGEIVEGSLTPSSEIKMHLRVYRENKQVGSVVHAHPPVATAFAVAGLELQPNLLPEAVILLGTVHVAPYATPGTDEVSEAIAPYVENSKALLMANHGALTWGKDIYEAFYRMESLEHYARISMYAKYTIRHFNPLTNLEMSKLIKRAEDGRKL
ncbi:MAG: class II aldolase/adducin family protein [Eubacteriales bacterium]|nr:class II aldolase/adducin family protein [Eubacteriales bacterium]